ncbi:MAG: PRC-barrel domain-containing protein [Chloroflexota bacterium]|nr:PRC-barrel domain-containing protein [Chloroflexota bacterium]
MLRSINDLQGCEIRATDGEIGSVDQFFFDDETWTVRYLVVDTGHWIPGRQVLISPIALDETDWDTKALNVSLTREQIKNSPGIDTDKSVSRQHEAEYSDYYGYPYYWGGGGLWGLGPYPAGLMTMAYPDRVGVATGYAAAPARQPETARREQQGDPHLRTTQAVIGYYIEAQDGEIGHVEDFLIDDETWAIRYMVIDTVNWWPGKKVVVAPQWIERVSWEESKVYVDLTRESIKGAPEFDATALVNREYEKSLYDHYGRPKYWD